ncbi:hypothetical protein ACOI22_08785 [Glaciecola sp. 2405UD65-10]|uniref:hypothetical protein n=1 Tax=Glaciecola sp. 2405UD65-10 TaxID=3397244 RepID=UPI003B58D844
MQIYKEHAQIMAALAALQQSKSKASEQAITDFLHGDLSEAARAEILEDLANDPKQLSEAVKAFSQLEEERRLVTPKEKSKRPWAWLSFGSSGLLGLAAVAYFMFIPVMNIEQINQQLTSSYSKANFNKQQVIDNLSMAKHFALNISALKEDIEWGSNSARVSLGVETSEYLPRECTASEDCEIQQLAFVLGKWLGLNAIQCSSAERVDTNYWQQQGLIYNQLAELLQPKVSKQLPLSKIDVSSIDSASTAVCKKVNAINKAKY